MASNDRPVGWTARRPEAHGTECPTCERTLGARVWEGLGGWPFCSQACERYPADSGFEDCPSDSPACDDWTDGGRLSDTCGRL